MVKKICLLLSCLTLGMVAGPAFGMRCDGKIINKGDHQAVVAGLCGKPAWVKNRRVYRSGIPRRSALSRQGMPAYLGDRELLIHNRSAVEVAIEIWVYNLGPKRLQRELIFEGGRLIGIHTLGYGY